MKITALQLRRIIKEEISRAIRENGTEPNIGKDIKGSAASEKASEKLDANPTIKNALDQITTSDGLAAFIQSAIKVASEKGIDRNKIDLALKKVVSTFRAPVSAK